MAFCQVFDFATARIGGLRRNSLINKVGVVALLALSATAFVLYAPLAYGNAWTKAECNRVKLFDTWDWDCNAFLDSYDQYNNVAAPIPQVTQTSEPAINNQPPPQPPVVGGQQDQNVIQREAGGNQQQAPEAGISGAPQLPLDAQGHRVIGREEKVEYRDQDGNLLNEDQVKELEGRVEFKTRYETRTRLIDADGRELPHQLAKSDGNQGVAPPHPDVNGVDQETKKATRDEPVPEAEPSKDGEKEAEHSSPKPASEGNEATSKPPSESSEATLKTASEDSETTSKTDSEDSEDSEATLKTASEGSETTSKTDSEDSEASSSS